MKNYQQNNNSVGQSQNQSQREGLLSSKANGINDSFLVDVEAGQLVQGQGHIENNKNSKNNIDNSDSKKNNNNKQHKHSIEQKYSTLYEAKLNPFQQFANHEKLKRFQNLSLPEKVLYSLTKFILANHQARSFIIFYIVSMHLLVFFSMYWISHNHCEIHDESSYDHHLIHHANTNVLPDEIHQGLVKKYLDGKSNKEINS